MARQVRDLVPEKISLPAEYTSALIDVYLDVHGGKVVAPALAQLQGALARGSVEVVTSYCEMWTRWLTRALREAGE